MEKAIKLPHSIKNYEELPAGCLYFPNCLNDRQQKRFIEACTALSQENGNQALKNPTPNEKYAFPVLYYNWPASAESLNLDKFSTSTQLSMRSATKVFNFKLEHQKEAGIVPNPISFLPETTNRPESCYGIVYPHGGEFGSHVDGANTWTFAISFGCSSDFFYDEPLEPGSFKTERHFIRLNSGDGCLFNGGRMKHGVSKIYSESSPIWWDDTHFGKLGSRFNIQFRDLHSIGNTYIPQFVSKYYPHSDSNFFTSSSTNDIPAEI